MDSPHSLSIQILLVTHVAHKTAAALSRRLNTRAIATTGLMLYVAAGAGCFFVDDIFTLLLMRAILCISVGLIMPLSTGLLAYYFPPEEQARLMELSAAMNQMGGVVATLRLLAEHCVPAAGVGNTTFPESPTSKRLTIHSSRNKPKP